MPGIDKIEQHISILEDDRKWAREKIIELEKVNSELLVSRDMMRAQFERHSNEHKTNYKELQTEFKGLKDDLSSFKGDVLRKLDIMSGRDSVIKMLATPAVTAIIVLLINYLGR